MASSVSAMTRWTSTKHWPKVRQTQFSNRSRKLLRSCLKNSHWRAVWAHLTCLHRSQAKITPAPLTTRSPWTHSSPTRCKGMLPWLSHSSRTTSAANHLARHQRTSTRNSKIRPTALKWKIQSPATTLAQQRHQLWVLRIKTRLIRRTRARPKPHHPSTPSRRTKSSFMSVTRQRSVLKTSAVTKLSCCPPWNTSKSICRISKRSTILTSRCTAISPSSTG